MIYVLEGAYVLEVDGKGAIPLKAGEARHAPLACCEESRQPSVE